MLTRERRTALALLEAYKPLACSIANRYGRSFPWLRDDFRSLALEALWRAALDFDPVGEQPFARLVRWKVRSVCGSRIDRERSRNRAAFRNVPADEELDPLNLVADDTAEIGAKLEAEDLAEHVLRRVDPRSRAMLRLAAEGATHETIAEAAGVSTARVGQLLDRAREKLRSMVEA